MVFGKKKTEKTFIGGKQVIPGEEAPAQVPPLEIPPPLPPAGEQAQPEQPAPEEVDYFEAGRDQGFMEGLSYAMALLRQAQNEVLQKRKGV